MQYNNSVRQHQAFRFRVKRFIIRTFAFLGNKTHIILASSQGMSICQSERNTQGKRESAGEYQPA
jgi:hypothetical protein